MSPQLPRVTANDLLRALGRAGWRVKRSAGSHTHLVHDDKHGMRVTIPMHAGVTIGPRLLDKILAQAGMTADELRRLL
jgi:predicted RNA binding protein YcfA (HicA-like mRNA interferase family)